MRIKFLLCLLFCICFTTSLCANLDSVRANQNLDSVFIINTGNYDRLITYNVGKNNIVIDSAILQLYRSSSLADIIADQTLLYIKSYGSGSLATPSFRGTGASHTKILWNGISISNAMYGQIDFNFIPLSLVKAINIQAGASSALWGSGSIGGSINLKNSFVYDNQQKIFTTLEYGSFSNKFLNVLYSISTNKIYFSFNGFYNEALNNYEFKNITERGHPTQKMPNASYNKKGFISELGLKLNTHNEVNILTWYQNNYRNIIPGITALDNHATQKDYTFKLMAIHFFTTKKFVSTNKLLYANDELIYISPQLEVSTSKLRTVQFETDNNIIFTKNHIVNLSSNIVNYYTAKYIEPINQYRVSFFTSYKYLSSNKKFLGLVSLRKEKIFNYAESPNTFFVAIDYDLWRGLILKANVSRTYNFPSLNDLYWYPNGNPDLKPEQGYTQEFTILKKIKNKNNIGLTFFNGLIDDWIMWLPDANGQWTPKNINNVWNRGIEFGTNWVQKISNSIIVQMEVKTHLNISTIRKTEVDKNVTEGKDLIYTPRNKLIWNTTISVYNITLIVNYTYGGLRYISSDNKITLPSYNVINISINYLVTILKRYNINAYFKVNNLLSEEYQLMSGYPSPFINFKMGLRLDAFW